MRMRAAVAALILAVSAPALAQSAPQDWNQTVANTGKGHRVGSPEAPVQLIEFVSYTCPHCAHYAEVSEGALRLGYVGEGKAAVEVRHVIRNPVDLAAALTTECGPEDKFFDRHRAMFLGYEGWIAKAQAATPAQQTRWRSGTTGQQMQAIANDLDFYQLMEPQGIGVAALDRCLTDDARAQAIMEASAANSNEFAVPGTPSFVINGALLPDVYSWEALQPLIEQTASAPAG
jgi:protein-disulfide isomerase